METAKGKTVDFHAHPLPGSFLAGMEALGIDPVEEDGFPLPAWSEQAHLAFMDEAGIDVSLLSISSPHLYSGDGPAARAAARAVNEDMARLCRNRPDRFRRKRRKHFFSASPPITTTGSIRPKSMRK